MAALDRSPSRRSNPRCQVRDHGRRRAFPPSAGTRDPDARGPLLSNFSRLKLESAVADNRAQAEYWNSPITAPWVRLQERLDAFFAPLAEAGISAAQPASG